MSEQQLAIILDNTLKPSHGYRFNGPEFEPKRDTERLTGQYDSIFAFMRDGEWRTLAEISKALGYPESSISAQLRHMRKPRFGSHTVNRRHVAEGLFQYQLIVKVSE